MEFIALIKCKTNKYLIKYNTAKHSYEKITEHMFAQSFFFF